MIAALGASLSLLGGLLLYLASPNQRATARRLPRKPLAWCGTLLFVAGLAFLLGWAGPATAVFIWMTLAMLVWTITPPLAAWVLRPRGDAR